jgi:D-amino-acid dehydrogenase
LGVQFRFGVNIRSLRSDGADITGVETDAGLVTADRYLLALGSYSAQMLAPVGLKVPVYPVKGYSITVPITDAAKAPESTIMDETHKVAVTRLGERIRVGGTAQLSGFDLRLDAGRRRTLEHVCTDLFPRGGDVSRAEFWTGLRPMTPDGTPIVGPTRIPNLWLATGHGTLGWTMAAGTGRLLADWMGGGQPEIDTEGLTIGRYGASMGAGG